MMRKLILLVICFFINGCDKLNIKSSGTKSTYFIGLDVSGSFTKTESFSDSLKFLSYYIYGHLNGLGNLSTPKDLYLGGIGGKTKEDPLPFFPIHDFQDLLPKQIEQKLINEFGNHKETLTDFNIFFERAALIIKQKNLVLAPINIILISDGVPEILKINSGKIKYQAYSNINLEPLEYLSRDISVRLLYTTPKVGMEWVNYVPKKRIKIWSVEKKVMLGWKKQLERGKDKLWIWINDNIDRKIYRSGIKQI